ncbi:hypothetical protein [Streptoalloteichus hindustanus]|uniref:Uncharacterized protein n=1 Tax=Streptoalloteichus hindustanus TaxID=2017 RepID=A0A1M5MCB0_STRHI|nr:hypothetical protein [Streptoalloteichus hindustanus]SHG74906.1 hypothetical protein SAMN05444320_11369 [Streptoalloteichus hindustanus]
MISTPSPRASPRSASWNPSSSPPPPQGTFVVHAGHRRRDACRRAAHLVLDRARRAGADLDAARARADRLVRPECVIRPNLADHPGIATW